MPLLLPKMCLVAHETRDRIENLDLHLCHSEDLRSNPSTKNLKSPVNKAALLSASKFVGWFTYMMRQILVLFKPPKLIEFPIEKWSSPAICLIVTITIERSNVCSSETGGSSHQGLCLTDSAKPFFYWSFLKNKYHSLPTSYTFYKDAEVLYSCRLLWTKFQLQIYKDLKICVVGCNTVDHQHTQIILNSSEFSMVHYLAQNFFISALLRGWSIQQFLLEDPHCLSQVKTASLHLHEPQDCAECQPMKRRPRF
jgi:hypothetical protein